MSPCGRRAFLAAAVRAGFAVGCGSLAVGAGCRRAAEAPMQGPLRLELASLAEGARLRHEVAGRPVEVLRRGDVVTARSLLCTHQGCEVAWHEGEDAYVCPCHDGRFAADGQPLYGPPRLPLRELTVIREGDRIVIGA